MFESLLQRLIGFFEPHDALAFGRIAPHGARSGRLPTHRRRGFRLLLATEPDATAHRALSELAEQCVANGGGLLVFDDTGRGLSAQHLADLARAHGREADLLFAHHPDEVPTFQQQLRRTSLAHVSAGPQFSVALIHLCQSLKHRQFGRGPQVLVMVPHSVMAFAGIMHELCLYGRRRGFSTVYTGPDFAHMDDTNLAYLPTLLSRIEVRAVGPHTPADTLALLGLPASATQTLPPHALLLQTRDAPPQVCDFDGSDAPGRQTTPSTR